MKAKTLSILALLLMAVTGTMAQQYNYIVCFMANNNTVSREIHDWDFQFQEGTLIYTFKCNDQGDGDLDKIIQTLYGHDYGRYCLNDEPQVSGYGATATLNDGYLWISINKDFNGSATFEGLYYDEDDTTPFQYRLEITCTPSPAFVNITAHEGKTGEYWATYYNSKVSYKADANTMVYQAAVNGTKTGVTLTEVKDKEIPARKAVILKSSASTIELTPAATNQLLDGNELLGTDDEISAPTNAYCLSNETTGLARGVGFYKYTATDEDGKIPAHRAYLEVDDDPSATRGFLGFDDDDNTTRISFPEAVVIGDDGPVYDLSGRRVTGLPKKGIYVKNGKKHVIK